jgi:Mor family transcriptional regulator
MADVLEDLHSRLLAIGFKDPQIEKLIIDVRRDWAGETSYISLEYEKRKQRCERNMAIIRAYKSGERVELLARRYKLTTKRIYEIING